MPSLLARLLARLPADTLPFVKFCLIGGVNTLIHAAVLITLREGVRRFAAESVLNERWVVAGVFPVGLEEWANVVAFLVANGFSYFANSRWSFDAELRVSRYARFLPTSLVGFLCAYGIMAFVNAQGWHYLLAVVIQVCVTPFINFSLLRLFVFPRAKKNATGRDCAGSARG
jgi:putative flippase GtrA